MAKRKTYLLDTVYVMVKGDETSNIYGRVVGVFPDEKRAITALKARVGNNTITPEGRWLHHVIMQHQGNWYTWYGVNEVRISDGIN